MGLTVCAEGVARQGAIRRRETVTDIEVGTATGGIPVLWNLPTASLRVVRTAKRIVTEAVSEGAVDRRRPRELSGRGGRGFCE
jgi:hypothetical protein